MYFFFDLRQKQHSLNCPTITRVLTLLNKKHNSENILGLDLNGTDFSGCFCGATIEVKSVWFLSLL